MHRWNERVKQPVPSDRRLAWEPRDGWEPLCEFLEAPLSERPLPSVNDTPDSMKNIVGGALAVVSQLRERAFSQPHLTHRLACCRASSTSATIGLEPADTGGPYGD